MADDDLNESRMFPGPMARTRGRVSRRGAVSWSPAIRTYRGREADERTAHVASNVAAAGEATTGGEQFFAEVLDYEGTVLLGRPVHVDFFASDQEAASFTARVPYEPNCEQLQLRVGERVLSRIDVPTERPYFTLLHPNEDDYVDPRGVLHLHWAAHSSEYPIAYFVRYTNDGGHTWHRPGVNLSDNDYYLDLRDLPGGQRRRAEVLATNGYRTSYVRTRWFQVPRKAPIVLLGETVGPTLYGQGFSLEQGPLPVQWHADDGTTIATGATCDVRLPFAGTRAITADVTDGEGLRSSVLIGRFDNTSGKVVMPEGGF